MLKKIKLSPYKVILFSFFFIILTGGTVLSFPALTVNSQGTKWIDGIFTAASAVCVTGLAVNDIGTTYNIYGKILIMFLIQLGGLGVVTFSSLFIMTVSRKINYYTKKLVQEDMNTETVFNIQNYVRKVVLIVLVIEFTGAFFLFFEFIKLFNFKKALFYALFHSVSAFCNAGFSLFPDNLMSFKGSIIINTVIPFLIITGGIGFATLINLWRYFQGKDRRLTITSRISLIFSSVLLIAGTFIIFLLEYRNPATMGNFTLAEKIGGAFFQSVTARTAGFNTISIAGMEKGTVFLLILLMFIGASPASTGGGVKTTTVGLIILGIISTIQNREDLEFNRRRISWYNFNRSVAIISISLIYICGILILLILSETGTASLDLSFELVSAFGTVGLTRNLTPGLGNFSKVLIIVTMFIGRVGPLTAALALSYRRLKKGKYRYPEENILIG